MGSMFYKRLLIGIILVLLGVGFIVYGIPSNHIEVDTWYQKIGNFFLNTWNKVTGYKQPIPPTKYTARSLSFLIGGIAFVALGVIMIFRKIRKE